MKLIFVLIGLLMTMIGVFFLGPLLGMSLPINVPNIGPVIIGIPLVGIGIFLIGLILIILGIKKGY